MELKDYTPTPEHVEIVRKWLNERDTALLRIPCGPPFHPENCLVYERRKIRHPDRTFTFAAVNQFGMMIRD